MSSIKLKHSVTPMLNTYWLFFFLVFIHVFIYSTNATEHSPRFQKSICNALPHLCFISFSLSSWPNAALPNWNSGHLGQKSWLAAEQSTQNAPFGEAGSSKSAGCLEHSVTSHALWMNWATYLNYPLKESHEEGWRLTGAPGSVGTSLSALALLHGMRPRHSRWHRHRLNW